MREIEFRIWDKELKEIHYLSLEDLCEDDYWYNDCWSDGETSVWSVLYDCNNDNERFEINQYTGLTDKNHKKIFEGDIVSISGTQGLVVCIVKWEDCGYIIQNKDYKFSLIKTFRLEVIGNIYENPELLEVEKCEN